MPGSSEGKLEKRVAGIHLQNLEPDTGMQLTEALRIQLDVQRRLQEQLEIQENLQQRIEEQGTKLQKMFEEELKASRTVMELREELHGVGVGAASPGVSEQEELQGVSVFFPGISEQEVFDDVQ
uniref:MYB-CC type transcription factor LHEQLE-containing domain-containing protein n=1 Tax=Arundo donax TaxID=35708 RepID=A0A0A8ZX50_ARUDO